MVERGKGFDAIRHKLIEQAVVEVESPGIRRTGAFGKYARPRYREAIGPDSQVPDQEDIFLVAVIVIVGAIGVAVIGDLARRVRERIPDRAASAIFGDRALDLIRGSGNTPDKAVGEAGRGMP